MKKFLYLFLLPVMFLSCSGDDVPSESEIDPVVSEVLSVLNGHFVFSVYQPVTNTTETEELTFSPFSEPKNIVSVLEGEFVAHGNALVVSYFNDEKFKVSDDCFFSVTRPSSLSDPLLWFYEYNENGEVVNRSESSYIKIISGSSFVLYPRGGTADENGKKFVKQ